MSIQDKLRSIIKILKLTAVWGSSGLFFTYHITQMSKTIEKVVNTNVLEREKKHTQEYIYIDDPIFKVNLQLEQDRESKQSIGISRIWKSLKHSLAWRLLWLCHHGNSDQRNIALEQLAALKRIKHWDCLKLAQAMDKNIAVLLARTRGADLRYFLPPPIHVRRAALSAELLSFKFRDMILSVNNVNPHSCIQHFLHKYFSNVQEQAMEADTIPVKPESISEHDLCILCLDALYHHMTLFHSKNYKDDLSAVELINMGLLPRLSEILLRYRNDIDIDLAVLKVLTVLSVHSNLLADFFQNGLIGELARLVKSKDVRLSSSAAVCLANLSGEYCYGPGLYLLHPIYRTTTPHSCETLLIHGLRGGVFVTWRQRDKKCAEPIGIIEGTINDVNCNPCEEKTDDTKYLDTELKQVMEDLKELDEEVLLSDIEVVLHDLPIQAKREPLSSNTFTVNKKRMALIQEDQDHCNYTFCWPKDWLPKDCTNLRILGINYCSSLSEWLERCPLQTAEIVTRATELGPRLIDAGVGRKNIPIVWLAHSMGGLIVKKVLIDASQSKENDFKKLADNTKAILFYSTPHKGSSLATMPRAAAAVLWPSNAVRQLQENSPVLLELQKSFIYAADKHNWETISFGETLPTLITAFKVPVHFVEPHSADLGRGVYYQLPLDHLSICKPATRQSILYTTVLDVLQRVTYNDVELKYSNTFGQWILEILWWVLMNTAKEAIENIDDTQSIDGLHQFE